MAIEELQRAESEYQHKRRLRLDYLNQQLRAEQHSVQVFEGVDAAAREYWLVTGGDQEKLDEAPDAGAEPTLNEYSKCLTKRVRAVVHGRRACADWLGCVQVFVNIMPAFFCALLIR